MTVCKLILHLLGLGLMSVLVTLPAGNVESQTTYRVVDVGRLTSTGTYFSHAEGLNGLNQVVGFTYVQTGYRAFLYQPGSGVLLNLGDLPGGDDFSMALAVNDWGVVVGSSSEAVFVDGVWTTLPRAFRWTARGGLTDIGADVNPNGDSFATDINASGWVGGSYPPVGVAAFSEGGFLWKPGGAVTYLPQLDTAGQLSTEVDAITDAGLVVGTSKGSNVGIRAFQWDEGNGISTIPGDTTAASRARDVNGGGLVAGQGVMSDGQGGYEYVGIVLEGGQLTTIDLPSGALTIDAVAVNAQGEVVGYVAVEAPTMCIGDGGVADPVCYSDTHSDRAFVWTATTGLVDLTSQIDPADPSAGSVVITSARDINDHGFIAANGYVSGESGQHAFLLVPTLVFSDGFESGDTTRWSAAAP